ncbi:MAG TPA: cyclodeaminase/cyclohydrolase family protein [Gemmatimonadales bacterium]|nr:cyclodeaminase/cyclohydrolase family protein [Gemmatimonadales bacterium]
MSGPDASAPLREWSDALARRSATPAGGSAAAIAASLAASLVAMVGGLTASRASYAETRPESEAAAERGEVLRRRLLALAEEDAQTFQDVLDALALPRTSEEAISRRNAVRDDALKAAAAVQYELLLLAGETVDLAESLVHRGLRSAVGDAGAALFLAAAGARAAYWAIRSNLRRLHDDPEAERMADAALERLELIEGAETRVRMRLAQQL